MYEGDLAALVVSLSSISGRQMQSKYSINLELFSANSTCRWTIRLSVEEIFGLMGIAFMNLVILYRVCVTNEY
jgi:hypothetical protein